VIVSSFLEKFKLTKFSQLKNVGYEEPPLMICKSNDTVLLLNNNKVVSSAVALKNVVLRVAQSQRAGRSFRLIRLEIRLVTEKRRLPEKSFILLVDYQVRHE